ncbi:hypothetical protein C1H46_043475 [Malus baccata]|uniref:Uncharacterized protein n=1 Tax=Malus baccata TaxID=106549 RepID=A0A540KAM5_MALBA|nr:hypothetical protein C1H46_043475 [Malus baccata]
MSSPRASTGSTVQDCWDCMLPGPPSRNNFGSADLSLSGLLAFPSGSSISVLDVRSMQLIVTIPMPPPAQSSSSTSSSLSPFVTSVRWTPLPLRRDLLSTEPSSSHLLLAAGDRQGRIALLDLRLKSPILWFDTDSSPSKLAIQDLAWVQARPDSYLLASISGFSTLSLYNSSTGRCFWKYDAAPEVLSCIRRDPFDSRHFCVVGLKGFLLSVTVLGETESDVIIKEFQIRTDSTELLKLERDMAGGVSGNSSSASAVFPTYAVRFAFSLQWRHILFVTFPRELVVFDLQYETPLFSATLPRGCGKFLDVLPDPNYEFLYCAHLDGKLRLEDNRKDDTNLGISEVPVPGTNTNIIVSSTGGLDMKVGKQIEKINGGRGRSSNSTVSHTDLVLKISLVGQLQLLSSAVTMLAVPSPSSTATLGRGGNYPVVAVPLVALGTQSGTVDIVDVSANAVAASFSVHNGTVRGLRWLGNSRLVSFSYSQVSEKSGGFINRLIVTCVRSGLNRQFRVLQKPERAPIRALRASSSGRYLLILLRDAPVEVWAMTKSPIMLRSLALPFTVLEWTLPAVPRPAQNKPATQSSSSSSPKDHSPVASDGTSSPTKASSDSSELLAFALYEPKWPSSSFVSSDGLITAMAYRLPHVVMGDRSGNIRWWDVTTGYSSSFNTHREGIRRIKFSPVVPGDHSRGRVAVLFYDNTFSVFDLDSPDPLANSLLQPQFPGTLVLELDWLPLRTDKNDPLLLCIAGADSSFRLLEINIVDKKLGYTHQPRSIKERFRPMPLCSPILLPTPHALALRVILQLGVKPSWFNTCSTTLDKRPHQIPGTPKSNDDLRSYLIDLPPVGDPVVPELLLKVLEPYRKEGCILDDERAKLYAMVVNRGFSVRFAFAAAIFGESSEALFWLQLPRALNHLMNKMVNKSPQKAPASASVPEIDDASMLNRITSKGKSVSGTEKKDAMNEGQLRLMAFEPEDLWANASERIPWHEKLEGEDAIQNRVHELVSIGNLEAAVSLLLSTPPESNYFSANALRAVALSSAVSKSLLELAVKVVAANMVRNDRSLSGTHLLCAVGRYQEACSQLQDAGCWTDAATLAATHLKGSDYARVLLRWASHVLRAEHNIWRALILYVAAGALQEALAALREAQQPDTAAMFILACRETHANFISDLGNCDDESSSSIKDKPLNLPGLGPESEDVMAVSEYYGQYQRKLVHLCMDSQPFSE